MRKSFNDPIDNALTTMYRNIRDSTNQATYRETSYDARSTDYRRNGVMNFGALQMMSLDSSGNFAMVGVSGGSVTVGI